MISKDWKKRYGPHRPRMNKYQNARQGWRLAAGTVLAAACLVASGCTTSPVMKGSPFYTGEFRQKPGPAEDRIPAWPLVYYRDPSLSVLWPIFESVRGESFAIRPFYSAYDIHDPVHREWNVLWPLIQSQPGRGTGRAVPFFWGDDYFVGFPLYWRYTGADRVTDVFFPFWWYHRDSANYRLYAALGLVGASKSRDSKGWYVFPFYGSREDARGGYHRWEFLLAHQYESSDGDSRVNTLLPLWWFDRSPAGRTFLSPLWMSGEKPSGDSWKCLLPVFFSKQSADERALYTLLGGRRSSSHGSGWIAPVLLSFGSRDRDSSSDWFVWPLAHVAKDRNKSASHVFPLFYTSRDAKGRRFVSLPWTDFRQANGSGWQLAPPFYFHNESAAGSRTLTPIYSRGESVRDQSTWSLLVPLYYAEQNRDSRLFATLLGGYRSGRDGESWMTYPLLTWNSRRGTTNDFWALAPLVHFRKEPDSRRSHVVPFYYWNSESRTFLSLPYSKWASGREMNTLIPPLLAWRTERARSSDLWLLAGLGRYSSGPDARASYLLPLVYDNPKTGTRLTPLYCRWTDGEGSNAAIPPLLGMMSTTAMGTRELWALAGLYHHEWDRDGSTLRDHLLPFYAYSPGNYFYTLLFGSKGDERSGLSYYFTPLVGSSRRVDESSFWVFPFYGRTVNETSGDSRGHILWGGFNNHGQNRKSTFFPFWSHQRFAGSGDGSSFERTSAALWLYGDRHVKNAAGTEDSSYLFPLWSRDAASTRNGASTNKTAFLLALYDTKHVATPAGSNYHRKRILWHVWHYENTDGDVSVDCLPGLAYDRKKDGFKQVSFLWRLFRWQRDAQGDRKLDLFFIPLIREG